MERTFYRIVRGPEVTDEDFMPAKTLGKPLRHQSFARQWAEGVSVFGTFDRAVFMARRFQFKLGRYIAAVSVPPGAAVEVEQSGDDPLHYTLYGTPRRLRSLVSAPPARIAAG